jgi:peptide/nickel transport system permease protein
MGKIFKMVAQRLGLGLLTLLVVSLIIFLGVELLPGDLAQAILGQSATEETVAAIRRELKLDLPAYQRYFEWLVGILQGDFGKSLANKREISELIGVRLGNTLFMAALAAIIAVPLAVTLGILAALHRNSIFDRTVNILTLSSISFPEFFIAYILILFLSVNAGIFPSISNVSADLDFWDRVYRSTLPALTLTLVVVAHMMRMTRAAIINLLASPYIEMANLKGLTRSRIIVKHAMPNALAPIINVIVINLAYLVVGVVIVEVVFVYPGLGQLLVDSVSKRDLPVVQASDYDHGIPRQHGPRPALALGQPDRGHRGALLRAGAVPATHAGGHLGGDPGVPGDPRLQRDRAALLERSGADHGRRYGDRHADPGIHAHSHAVLGSVQSLALVNVLRPGPGADLRLLGGAVLEGLEQGTADGLVRDRGHPDLRDDCGYGADHRALRRDRGGGRGIRGLGRGVPARHRQSGPRLADPADLRRA